MGKRNKNREKLEPLLDNWNDLLDNWAEFDKLEVSLRKSGAYPKDDYDEVTDLWRRCYQAI